MIDASVSSVDLDPPGSIPLRASFFLLWGIDLLAATLFFAVPYAYERNPITVYLYGLFGVPGVVLAAVTYAAVVVALGNLLPDPVDGRFARTVVALYGVLAVNNVVLLVFRTALLDGFV